MKAEFIDHVLIAGISDVDFEGIGFSMIACDSHFRKYFQESDKYKFEILHDVRKNMILVEVYEFGERESKIVMQMKGTFCNFPHFLKASKEMGLSFE